VSPEALGALVFCLALGLLFAGMPVAFALFAANLVGAWFLLGDLPGLLQLVDNATAQVTSFTLVAVPLFVLMGSLMFHSGLALRVFDALDALIGRLPGRLCYLTVAGSTAFSTLTGSSLANTAMLGALMVPEMERRGYARHMAIGPVVGTGGLAMLIPPSSLGVLLGSLAGINIGALLIAGLLPGLLLAVLYAGVVWLQVRRDPSVAPAYDVPARPRGERLRLVARILLPLGLVLFSVVGLLVLGIATPSEAAAFGVLSVAGIAAAGRRLTRAVLARALTDTASVSGMVFVLIMAAAVFSQLLAFSGASRVAVEWALSLGQDPLALLLLMFAVLLVLGMFIDQISIMLLTIPIFMPLVKALGLDPVWFGLLMLLALEMSLTTPPFGLLLFLMQGVAPPGTTFGDVTRAAVPYLVCNFIAAALIIAVPAIALWLPELWLR
jgi:tripartite ATP-independent transporter DctM subunit